VFKSDSQLVTLGGGVFEQCVSLKNIKLPDGITDIPNNTFWNCVELNEIVISNNVKTIGTKAFNVCSKLNNIFFIGNAQEFEQINIANGNNYFINAKKYYYSESQPAMDGHYWHYLENVPTAW